MSETLDRDQLLKLTLEVVEAYVSSHRVAPTELEVIIGSVAGSLAVGDPPQAVPDSFRSYARSRRILALHTKNIEYAGWGSSWATRARGRWP
jgi:predicted transcriptional regulator